jgi:murein DD-endopeptidase MepM/ murein hydrolase activator NlpD
MNEPKEPAAEGRSYPPLFRLGALLALLVFLFGGGWASLSPGSRLGAGRPGGELELSALGRRLSPAEIADRSPAAAAEAASALVRASRRLGLDPREELESAFPKPSRLLGMLSLDRDIEDFRDYAGRDDATGAYYSQEAALSLQMRPLRSRYEAAFAAARAALTAAPATDARVASAPAADVSATKSRGAQAARAKRPRPYIAAPSEVWLPPKSDLPLSHPFALDVFFQAVSRSGEAERGPAIFALYPGIVIAAASDWSGGGGPREYKGGGLSPAAGNGLVVYDPASRLYCSYFHLSGLDLRVGDLVEAGQTIGRGGNSGMNARSEGHGMHIHIEIFDAARDSALPSSEILQLLKK